MFFDGETDKSALLQTELIPLCDALRCEVNPIPVKAALAEMGLCKNILRAPLTGISPENAEKLMTVIKALS